MKDYIERHNSLILPSTISSSEDKVIVKTKGVWIWDHEGKKYFDASSQVSMVNIGHSHPKLIRWMRKFLFHVGKGQKAGEVIATDGYYHNELFVDGQTMELTPASLIERLAPHTFGKNKIMGFFNVGGTLAVDDDIRYFITTTKKPHWIAFEKGFHGRHGESRDSSSANPIHWNETDRNSHVFFLPFPETKADLDKGLEMLNSIPLDKCACFIYEPVQGEGGGMRVGWHLKKMEEVLKKEGLFSISDEIQAGLGRCGEWFAYQRLGLSPDGIVLGKSLGTILPVSGFVFKKELFDKKFPKGKISGTYPGYALGMAAANFVLRIYEEEKIVGNVQNLEKDLSIFLSEATIGKNMKGMGKPSLSVDGLGFMRSIKTFDEFDKPDINYRDFLNLRLREQGIWTYPASISFPAIRITPPLVSTLSELDHLYQGLKKAL